MRVLFQWPPSELIVTVSVSISSPVAFSENLERESVLLRRSASRVPHSSRLSSHLCPFPLCTALPCALVGRDSHEYYEHSVILGLASFRPSRVPSLRNVLERRRLPIHPLQCPRWASAITQGVPSAKVEPMARDGVGIRCAADECAVPPLEIGMQTMQS